MRVIVVEAQPAQHAPRAVQLGLDGEPEVKRSPLANLLTELAAKGLITDSTTAS